MIRPLLKLDERFKKRVSARYERFNVQGGILEDKRHFNPRPAIPVSKLKKKTKQPRQAKVKPEKKPTTTSKKKTTLRKKAKKTLSKTKKKLSKVYKKAKKSLESKKSKLAKRSEARKKAMLADHRRRGLGTMEGGPVRLKKTTTGLMISQIAEHIRVGLGVDWLTRPFRSENTPEMKKLRRVFFELVRGKTKSYGAVEAAFREVLRLPILRQRYGRNTEQRAKEKTFNRFLIDTGQFYRNIKSKVRANKKNV